MSGQVKLSIIIPVFNNWTYTKNVVENLKGLCPTHYEVIIVDNASSDETQTNMVELAKSNPVIKYIRNDENLGFGKACNIGFHTSLGQNVMFLNNDIKFGQPITNWINDFVDNTLANNPNKLIGPTGGFVDPKDNFAFKYETSDPTKEMNYMSGWCLSATRDTWHKLALNGMTGPFDEAFYLYFEDTSLSFVARQLGVNFLLHPLPLTHFARKTSSKFGMIKHYATSREIFLSKWKHLLK